MINTIFVFAMGESFAMGENGKTRRRRAKKKKANGTHGARPSTREHDVCIFALSLLCFVLSVALISI